MFVKFVDNGSKYPFFPQILFLYSRLLRLS